MLSLEAIVTSVFRQAEEELPGGLAIAWPGRQLDTESIGEWIELWCDDALGVVQRDQPPERREIALTVHVFVRPSNQTTRVHELAETTRRAFHARTISIIEPGDEDGGIVGVIRFREADVRDLTRLHAEVERRPLHHLVVTVRGTAQEAMDG
jgi:hypothetical protein